MKVSLLDVSAVEEYDKYVLSHQSSLFYYGSKYKDFLKMLLGCDEHYLVARDQSGAVRGILPLLYIEHERRRVYNSLPYYGSNGGILTDQPAAYETLLNAYNEIASAAHT